MITPTDEQTQMRAVVREFLAARCSHQQLLAQGRQPAGFDPAVWRRVAVELGLLGMAVPESYGGGGFSPAELIGVLVECGRALYPGPLFASTVLASTALLASGDEEACAAVLPALVDGALVATVAVAERQLLWADDQIATEAAGTGAERRLSGIKIAVVHGGVADVLLVAARTENGVSLLRVSADAPGLSVRRRPGIDVTRALADIRFDETPARIVGTEGDGWPMIERVRDQALAAVAAEAVGGMARLTELAIDHARTREQFGVPIGSFQAIKHRIADMVVAAQVAERSAEVLMWALDAGSQDFPIVAPTIFAHNADAYVTVAESALQVLGGMGFTAEHPAHLYVKRARASRALFGLPAAHRERIAPALLGS
jgi:alkylation response protein AidB-like acyl-CoA dehydrogenase